MVAQATGGPAPAGIVRDVLAVFQPADNYTLFRVLYYVHLLAIVCAFGPMFLYPRLRKLGDIGDVARLHVRFVMPALVVLWVAGMGMAGVAKFALAEMWWITITIVLWLVALVVSWFMIRPALTDASEQATKRFSMGVGITHVVLIVSLWLMIFKPFVDGTYVFND
jgi:uncharacterized membrane protein